MKTKLMQAQGPELSELLGQVLQPENNKHTIPHGSHMRAQCTKCDEWFDWTRWQEECIQPDSISFIWPEAMKWRDWCNQKFKRSEFEDAMYDVYLNTPYHDVFGFCMWLISDKCKPEHWLKASAICVLNSQEVDK